MVVTYYIKLFRTGVDRHNILMSLLLVGETIIAFRHIKKVCNFSLFYFTIYWPINYGWIFNMIIYSYYFNRVSQLGSTGEGEHFDQNNQKINIFGIK